MTSKIEKEVHEYFAGLPGKRGIDIPAEIYDRIFPVANGITQTIWGRYPTPHQLQHLYESGAHDPDAIHAAYDAMPHPHAPNLSVGEYNSWKGAYNQWQKEQS